MSISTSSPWEPGRAGVALPQLLEPVWVAASQSKASLPTSQGKMIYGNKDNQEGIWDMKFVEYLKKNKRGLYFLVKWVYCGAVLQFSKVIFQQISAHFCFCLSFLQNEAITWMIQNMYSYYLQVCDQCYKCSGHKIN